MQSLQSTHAHIEGAMKDFKARVETLLAQAAECDLIANLATDVQKRELFTRLGRDFRQMALRTVCTQAGSSR
jgi:hypothetical protein